MEAASEPLAGSVRQKAAMCSPGWDRNGSIKNKHRGFRSSVVPVWLQRPVQMMILITCGEFGQVLLLLGFVSKQQNSLEADGLVSSQSDANSQIVTADDLNQASVLEGGNKHHLRPRA